MTDKETGFIVWVEAQANKGSGKQAAKDIANEVNSSVKGGRIKVPVNIEVPIDKTKSKLTKAQTEVTSEIKKMASMGFSASGKDLDKLNSKFDKFKQEFKNAGKIQKDSTIFQGIKQEIAELEKKYKKLQKLNETVTTPKVKNSNKSKTREHTETRRERANRRENAKFVAQLERGASRGKASAPGADVNLGHRTSNWDDTYRGATDKSGKKTIALKNDILGTYFGQNSLMRRYIETEKLNRKAPVDVKIVDVATANKMTDEAVTNGLPIKRQIIDKKKNGSIDVRYEDAHAYGGNKKQLTEAEIAAEKAVITAKESAKELGGVEHDREDKDSDKFKMLTQGVMDFNEQAGKSEWDSMSLLTNMTMNRHNGAKGKLGLGYDKPTGEEVNHEEAKQVVSELMDTFTDIMSDDVRGLLAYEAQQRKILALLGDWRGIEELDKGPSASRKRADPNNSQLIKELKQNQKAIETQSSYDRIENTAERVADAKLEQETKQDAATGFNADAKANEAIEAIKGKKVEPNQELIKLGDSLKNMMCPCKDVLENILSEIKIISKNGINIKGKQKGQTRTKVLEETSLIPTMIKALTPIQENMKKALVPIAGTFKNYYEGRDIAEQHKLQRRREREAEQKAKETAIEGGVPRSTITTTKKDPSSWITKLTDGFESLTKTTANYRVIMAATSEEQDRMNAERVARYGLNRGRSPVDSGDKISFGRSMSLWRGKDKFQDLFKDLDLSEGVKIDTTAITDKLAKTLSGAEMFKAQTGGWFNNIMGAATGGLAFAFQPSLEKSRAQAEGVNQIMANIREAMNNVLQDILDKESKLSGLKASGDLKFKADGSFDLENSSAEAKVLVAQLEESKTALKSILADVGMVDEVVSKTGGRLSGIVKQLGFTSSALRENNGIVANLNAGLDKNGKALKFQTRMAEILNYSFQLMSRHIGQVFKNMLMMINPFNLIKKAFSDFMGYDVKWKRTMNVIKYNLRAIIRPFMEWLAQSLVNVLGIIDIIQQKVAAIFGWKTVSLFDQSAANAEKMREELEEAANVTAGFDELHDIGSDNSAENDLMGDIYKPQLSEGWQKFAEKLGDLFAGVAKAIKWCIDNWKLLAGLLAGFVIAKGLWNLLKWAKTLRDVFKALGLTSFTNLLGALLIVLGVIQTIKGVWDAIQWTKDWGKLLPSERREKGDKSIREVETGGAAIGAGIGTIIAPGVGTVIGAAIGDGIGEAASGAFFTAVSLWKGDSEQVQHFATKMGEGIGKTGGAVAGAVIGFSLGGPVGAAIGAGIGWVIGSPMGKTIGEAVGKGLNKIQDITRGVGSFQKLRFSAKDVEKAMEGVEDKSETYNKTLNELSQLEKQTGINGKELYDAVESGTVSYWGLTSAQQAVYDKYKELIQAESDMKESKKQGLEYSAKIEEQLAKESGNYSKYIATMQDGMKQGIISQEEMYDHFAQTYGSLDADAKLVFAEQLPAYMRQSIKEQAVQYETFGNKLQTFFKNTGDRISKEFQSVGISIKEGWEKAGIRGAIEGAFKGLDTWGAQSVNGLKVLQATQDDVTESTIQLSEAQSIQNKLQSEVDALQIKTKSSAEELYNQLNSGKITYESLTADQQLLVNQYGLLQEAMAKTDEVALKNASNIASVDLQTAKTTGNYNTFIDNLMAANERGEISTDEMYNLMAQAYADMDRSARDSYESQISEHGLMVDTVRGKSDEYLGVLGKFQKDTDVIWFKVKEGVSTKAREMWENTTTKFGEIRDKAGEIWNNIKKSTAITWEDIKKSAIGQKIQDITKNVSDKFGEIKSNVGKKWEEIRNEANRKWQEIKDSAVGQKVQEIWTNTINKIGNLKDTLGRKWQDIKDGAYRGWENIKNAIWGWVDNLWKSITGIFTGIFDEAQKLWQRVCNFFSGKGFRTNEQTNGGGDRNVSIQPYAAGTNYVPSDGLAYLHQGEAVIPKKYNQPYQQPNNTRLENAIEGLVRQVNIISDKVDQGINVTGQFVQRGSDLVATVQKANNKLSNTILSNKVYAR